MIRRLSATEIEDSTGRPTLKVVMSSERHTVEVMVPSGQSRGSREVFELRDKGGGMKKALRVLENEIAPALIGKEPEQKKIDNLLLSLDGTADKSRLGGNTMIGVSLATARLFAKEANKPLWKSIAIQSGRTPVLPTLFMNVINGGVHANFKLPFQEYMVMIKRESVRKSFELGEKIFSKLGKIIEGKYKDVLLGDEGGYSFVSSRIEEPFELLTLASQMSKSVFDMSFAIDVAASEIYKDDKYELCGNKYTATEMLEIYRDLANKFPLQSIEDPFEESDIKSFGKIVRKMGESVAIVGDDLTVTNADRITEISQHKAITAVIIKPNQIGTLSEVLKAAEVAQSADLKTIVSHRSGDTMDSFVADLAVGLGAYGIKAGSPGQAERRVKYKRLMEIEEQEMVK